MAFLSVMTVCVLCYLSVRVGAILRTPQQRRWAYASLGVAVAGFLVICVSFGFITREAVTAGVLVLLLGMMCLVSSTVTGRTHQSSTSGRDT